MITFFMGDTPMFERTGDWLERDNRGNEEDWRRTEAKINVRLADIRRTGRTKLTRHEYAELNSECNCGAFDYATRDKLLREYELELPD